MTKRTNSLRQLQLALLIGTFFIADVGFADDTHYQDYPLGGRAVGLGGAFVAIGSDPSGVFYNPAGTVDATRTSVQISTNLYGLEIADSFFSAVQRVADLDTVFTDLNVIPTTASFISSFGDTDAEGKPLNAYGLGAFVPSYRSLNIQNQARDVGACEELGYQRSLLDRTFYFGGSFARRVDDVWRAGISGFLAYRSLRDREETSCASGVGTAGTAFGIAETNLNMAVAAIFLSFGVKANLGYGWSLGANVTSPSIRVFDFADVRILRGSANPKETEYVLSDSQQDLARNDLTADTKFGASVRFGVAKVVPRFATFGIDVSLHAPTQYRLFAAPQGERDLEKIITIVANVERRMVANMNIGGEILIADPFSISGGVFTNFSSAPPIPGNPGESFSKDRLPHINSFGGSFVLGFFGEHTLTRVGVTLSYGEGTDVAPRFEGLAALGAPTEYVKVDFSQLFVFAFLSSTFRY